MPNLRPEASLAIKVNVPVKAGEVRDFWNAIPDNATVTISTSQGGDQRDPYPASHTFKATWPLENGQIQTFGRGSYDDGR